MVDCIVGESLHIGKIVIQINSLAKLRHYDSSLSFDHFQIYKTIVIRTRSTKSPKIFSDLKLIITKNL